MPNSISRFFIINFFSADKSLCFNWILLYFDFNWKIEIVLQTELVSLLT